MITVNDVYEYLRSIAPLGMKMDFDNVGLLVGRAGAEVSRILVSLDITHGVITEALEMGAGLIVSHHPLFFTLKSVTDTDTTGAKIIRLLSGGVSAICMHTNLDAARGGTNDALAAAAGISGDGREAELLSEDGYLAADDPPQVGAPPQGSAPPQDGATPQGSAPPQASATSQGSATPQCGIPFSYGRVGYLEKPCSLDEYLGMLKAALRTEGLRYYDAGREVFKVAVVGGSGGGDLHHAIRHGCDTFVTADVKYDVFLEAKELGINLIDGDHFCTENPVVGVIADKLRAAFPSVEVAISQKHGQTVKFY